ncbi:hypothetical protein [Streptomyces huasconensis]|uniref:hypothetical protein n=1 Tax=Streptomyces huasconensis TaxID=1854574 RepID=UPI0033D608AC
MPHGPAWGPRRAAAALAETVDAGRTIEAHRLGERRIELSERRIKEWTAWERYTLYLRSVLGRGGIPRDGFPTHARPDRGRAARLCLGPRGKGGQGASPAAFPDARPRP